MSRVKRFFLYLLSANLCIVGFWHLISPEFFVKIIPPGLPNPEWLNVLSGLAEIVIGVYLLEPRTRVYAAWGAIALAIAVLPANVHMYLENVSTEGVPGEGNPTANIVRLPFQLLFVAWAWWFTRPDETTG
jgi:uncharacterized membrane protein